MSVIQDKRWNELKNASLKMKLLKKAKELVIKQYTEAKTSDDRDLIELDETALIEKTLSGLMDVLMARRDEYDKHKQALADYAKKISDKQAKIKGNILSEFIYKDDGAIEKEAKKRVDNQRSKNKRKEQRIAKWGERSQYVKDKVGGYKDTVTSKIGSTRLGRTSLKVGSQVGSTIGGVTSSITKKIGGLLTKALTTWVAKLSIGVIIMKIIMSPIGMALIAFISAWVNQKIIRPIKALISKIREGFAFIRDFIDEWGNTIDDLSTQNAENINKIGDWFTGINDSIKFFFSELPSKIKMLFTGVVSGMFLKLGKAISGIRGLGKVGQIFTNIGTTMEESNTESKEQAESRSGNVISSSEQDLNKYGPNKEVARFNEQKRRILEGQKNIEMSKGDRADKNAELNALFERTAKKISSGIEQRMREEQQQRDEYMNFTQGSTTNNVNANAISTTDDNRNYEPSLRGSYSAVGGLGGDDEGDY